MFDPTTNQPLQLSTSQSNSNFKSNWINPTTSQNRTTPPFDVPSALLTNSVGQENDNSTWIPDSGASFHVTGDSQNIQHLNHFEGPDHIYIDNGEGLQVLGSGSSCLQNSKFPLYLNNLLHVPYITKNLLSVSKFALDNNVFFEFYPYHCNVKSQATNEVILRGIVGADGLYSFPDFKISRQHSSIFSKKSQINIVSVSANNSESFVVSSSKPSNLWHARLGHPNDHVLRLVLTQCNIHSINKTTYFCNSCYVGKSHRLSSSLSNTIYNSPLELIYNDLWGPSHVPSNEGYLYYVSFVDAFSWFTWLYPIKVKSEAITVFQSFKTMVELQFSSKIKSIQTNWGGEFRSFTSFLANHGIVYRLICPHTHHQNGIVERKHRHITELGLTLLQHASLPLKFWDYAFQIVLYLINRLPIAYLQFFVPYTVLYKTKPDYSFLKVFGCACFPFLRPYNKHKLEFRSQDCVFLGYSKSHKGYLCLAKFGRVYIFKDVVFNEISFSYNDLFPKPTLSESVTKQYFNLNPNLSPSTQQLILIPQPHITAPYVVSNTTEPVVSNTAAPFSRFANIHPMQTRSKSGKVTHRTNPSLLLTNVEPRSVS